MPNVNEAVTGVNDTATIGEAGGIANGTAGAALASTSTLNVLANDTDPDGDPLTITEINGNPVTVGTPVTVPNGTVTVNANGTVTFDPAPGYNGPADFTYTVTDGKPGTTPSTTTVSLDVGGVNDAPLAVLDTGSTDENTVLDVTAANGVILGAAGTDTAIETADVALMDAMIPVLAAGGVQGVGGLLNNGMGGGSHESGSR